MSKNYVYSLIPIGVALVAGGIQTAIIGYSFPASQWYIAALLIACVWLTAAMDAAAFHHSAVNGATSLQKIFLAISALSLVFVLSIDLVWMFAPDAFNTSDAIIKDLSYATGVNLAVSALCLLAWIFFSQDHVDEREAAKLESETIRDRRLAYLSTSAAQLKIDEMVQGEMDAKIARRNRKVKYINPPTATILFDQTPQPARVMNADAPAFAPQDGSTDPLADITETERALLAAVLAKTRQAVPKA